MSMGCPSFIITYKYFFSKFVRTSVVRKHGERDLDDPVPGPINKALKSHTVFDLVPLLYLINITFLFANTQFELVFHVDFFMH